MQIVELGERRKLIHKILDRIGSERLLNGSELSLQKACVNKDCVSAHTNKSKNAATVRGAFALLDCSVRRGLFLQR